MERVKLGDICNIKSSKRIYQNEYREEGVPFYRGKEISELSRGDNVKVELYISRERYNELELKFTSPKEGDLLITSVGTIGNTWVSDGRKFYYKDGNITQIVNNDKINTRYLSYLFKSDVVKRQYLKESTGTAQIALTIEKLNKLVIPITTLEVQEKIVASLDIAEELIYKRKAQIEALDELVKGVFYDMFGDACKNKYKFYTTTIDRITNKVTDGEHITPIKTKNGIKLLSARNVKNSFIDFEAGVDYVGNSEYERIIKRCKPEYGDILISCSGTIGRISRVYIKEAFVLVRSVALLKLKREIVNNIFIEKYLQTGYLQQIMNNSSNKSGQANLFNNQINQIPVIVPPLELQDKFAEIVVNIENQKKLLQQNLIQLENNFNSLMQNFFK